ncbi:MAG TPA: DoxX family protein [Nitrospiraceae bacterium]|jgi:putative oxidoreductase|nr:DoxX family protein [Nitrospiraceae bacterium]
MKVLFQTDDSWTGLILRVTLGLVMFPHGAQKLLGWYGGFGFGGTMNFFTETMHLPWLVAFLIIIGEFFGSLGLLAGFLTRFSAASIGVIMLGAVSLVHWPHGFFMNWFGKQQGEGYEYHLLVIGIAIALMITGAGRWSVDKLVAEKLAR